MMATSSGGCGKEEDGRDETRRRVTRRIKMLFK
jgi:hypothetical protein